jgi:hypothetical protein
LEIFASESKNIVATGRRIIHWALKKKISEFGAIFFQNHSRREKSKAWASLGTYFPIIEKYSRTDEMVIQKLGKRISVSLAQPSLQSKCHQITSQPRPIFSHLRQRLLLHS